MLKNAARKIFNSVGLEVSRYNRPADAPATSEKEFPVDFESEYIEIIKKVKPYTMTSSERLYQLVHYVKYIIENDIRGDFVECGVWRGGSILTMIETLKLLNATNRKIHLFDTFSSDDIFSTKSAISEDEPLGIDSDSLKRHIAEQKIDFSVNFDDVKKLMRETQYPPENIMFYVGRVEDTLPEANINSVALLRLDTDWYDSTKFQLESLYNKVTINGIVICDDYGFWKGHKKAVDEFLAENNINPLLLRNDYSCRLFIKNF